MNGHVLVFDNLSTISAEICPTAYAGSRQEEGSRRALSTRMMTKFYSRVSGQSRSPASMTLQAAPTSPTDL